MVGHYLVDRLSYVALRLRVSHEYDEAWFSHLVLLFIMLSRASSIGFMLVHLAIPWRPRETFTCHADSAEFEDVDI